MISVFTPTYNREKLLKRLYQSLLEQTDKNFEWIVVDDGSSDDTKSLISDWIEENKIVIKYNYQQNAGKHIAFNSGIDLADGQLYFCVDSDDFLSKTAIEDIRKLYQCPIYNTAIGVLALKSTIDGKLLSDNLPKDINLSTNYDLSSKYNCYGEKTLIYKTEILRKHRFPTIPNEKFIGECVLYDALDQFGPMLLLNKVITLCEYQEGGLSDSFFKNMLKNPIGYKIYHSQRINLATSFKERFNYSIRYNAFKFMSNDSLHNYYGPHHRLITLTIPFGFLLKIYYSIKNKLKP